VQRVRIVSGRCGWRERAGRIGHDAKLGQQNRRVKQMLQKMQKKMANRRNSAPKMQIERSSLRNCAR
jgi:hypothetical protein